MKNEYLAKCHLHQRDVGLFCTECLEFSCYECEDPHSLKGKLIPKAYIEKYFNCSYLLRNIGILKKDSILKAKERIILKYKEAEANLKKTLESVIARIDSFIEKPENIEKSFNEFKDLNLTDAAQKMLSNLSDEREDDYLTAIQMQENAMEKFVEKMETLLNNITIDIQTLVTSKQAVPSCFIAQCIGDKIQLYDEDAQKIESLAIPIKPNNDTEYITVRDKIYAIGGSGPIDDVNEINISKISFVPKEKLPHKKYAMSLIKIKNFIYSIGGSENSKTNLDTCEKYSILDNKWSAIPILSEMKASCGTFCLSNNTKLFAIAGGQDYYSDSFEMIDLVKVDKWVDQKVVNKFSVRYGVHCISISNNEALIYGGNNKSSECYRITMIDGEMKLEKVKDLIQGGEFRHTMAPVMVKRKCIYDFDTKGDIHTIPL